MQKIYYTAVESFYGCRIDRRVAYFIDEGKIFSRVKMPESCSGCYESIDGHPPQGTVFHREYRIPLGPGCRECGYHGFRWNYHYIPFNPWSRCDPV